MLDDGMDPNQTTTDYTRLISQDHVNLLLGTFSSLLNAPASAVAARNQMLYVEPSGGAATLFQRGFTDLFFAQPGTTASLPDQFLAWFSSLPADQRPKTAAYLTQDDPSASPAISVFVSKLQALGVTTVYNQTYDPSTSNFDSIASAVVHTQPQMIIQGSVTDDGAQFVRSLEKLNYSPKILFQTNSPTDATYPSAVGTGEHERRVHRRGVERGREIPGQRRVRHRVLEEVRHRADRGRGQLVHGRPGAPGRGQGGRQARPEGTGGLAAHALRRHHRRPAHLGLDRRPGGLADARAVAERHVAGRRPADGRDDQDRGLPQARVEKLMTELIQALIFGALIGGVYALMSTGLTLAFGVMKVVNMAQGAFLIASSYFCYALWQHFGIDPILAAFIVMVPMGRLGLVCYKLVIARLERIDPGLTIVATFALALVTESLLALTWGPNEVGTTPSYFNQAFHAPRW